MNLLEFHILQRLSEVDADPLVDLENVECTLSLMKQRQLIGEKEVNGRLCYWITMQGAKLFSDYVASEGNVIDF